MADILQSLGQQTDKTKGINLDLGLIQLNITLTLTGVRTLSDTLKQTLEQSEGTMQENVGKVVDTVRRLGVEDLRRWAEQGGAEERNAFNQLVSNLQQATRRGQEEAGEILNKLGGKITEAGRKMQGASSEEAGTSH